MNNAQRSLLRRMAKAPVAPAGTLLKDVAESLVQIGAARPDEVYAGRYRITDAGRAAVS